MHQPVKPKVGNCLRACPRTLQLPTLRAGTFGRGRDARTDTPPKITHSPNTLCQLGLEQRQQHIIVDRLLEDPTESQSAIVNIVR